MNTLLRRSISIYHRHVPQQLRSLQSHTRHTSQFNIRNSSTDSAAKSAAATRAETSLQQTAAAAIIKADDMHTTPKLPKYLGYAGTIPFLSGAALSFTLTDPAPIASSVQLYGSSILSFLGAVHWGVALQSSAMASAAPASSKRDFTISVVPSLVAWGAAMLPAEEGLFVLSISFAGMLLYDSYRFRSGQGVPSWYRRLRRPLSLAAVLGSLITMRSMWRADRCPRARAVRIPDRAPADAGAAPSVPDFVQVSEPGAVDSGVRAVAIVENSASQHASGSAAQ